MIVSITLLHTLLPNWGVRGMNALSVMKIILLLFIVVTGWVVLSGRVSSVPDPYASFHNSFAGSVQSSNPYAIALFKVLNSYTGYGILKLAVLTDSKKANHNSSCLQMVKRCLRRE